MYRSKDTKINNFSIKKKIAIIKSFNGFRLINWIFIFFYFLFYSLKIEPIFYNFIKISLLFGEISLSYIEYGTGVHTQQNIMNIRVRVFKMNFHWMDFPIMFDYYYYIWILFYKLYILCACMDNFLYVLKY